jgi:predicted 3-demethylubiquinone-9 3-methyltransferase (glyoxalase superfamily)
VISATFQLEGQDFYALNAGPQFTFSPAISLFVNCESPEEEDELWKKHSEGGERSRYRWFKDKFGIWWQIISTAFGRLLNDPDPAKSKRVMMTMTQMGKIAFAALQRA